MASAPRPAPARWAPIIPRTTTIVTRSSMQRSTPPTSHRRVSGSSRRAKVVATGIAVATLLLSIAAAVDSNRLISAWRANTGANLGTPGGTGGPDQQGRATAEIVIPTMRAVRPVPAHPGSIQHGAPARPNGVPSGTPAVTPTGSSGWPGSVGPACDRPTPSGTATPQPSTTNSPTPGSTPNPPSTAGPAVVSTSDYATPCPSSPGGTAPRPTSAVPSATSDVPVLTP